MNPRQIHHFFATLAAELRLPARVYLTGAAAGAIFGRVRPSADIDFGLRLASRRPGAWADVERAVNRTSALTGIAASVAEDIDRWGMITLLDYRRKSRAHRRFGGLEVRLLDPVTWSIGKLTRLLEADVEDVVSVFRRQRVDAEAAARTWGHALRASPASTAQFSFRRNVEAFLEQQGPRIWGRRFAPPKHIRLFHRAARIPIATK